MSTTIRIQAKDVPAILLGRDRKVREATLRGVRMAAQRTKSILVSRTPVDTGQLKNTWRKRDISSIHAGKYTNLQGPVAEVYNDAPHAGIVEMGARPHGVNAEGRASILRWVERHFSGLSPQEMEGIVFAIVAKLKKHGQKATYFVRNSMPEVEKAVHAEIERAIAQAAATASSKP